MKQELHRFIDWLANRGDATWRVVLTFYSLKQFDDLIDLLKNGRRLFRDKQIPVPVILNLPDAKVQSAFGTAEHLIVTENGRPLWDQFVLEERPTGVILPYGYDTHGNLYFGIIEEFRPVARDPYTGEYGLLMAYFPGGFTDENKDLSSEQGVFQELREELGIDPNCVLAVEEPQGEEYIFSNAACVASSIIVRFALLDLPNLRRAPKIEVGETEKITSSSYLSAAELMRRIRSRPTDPREAHFYAGHILGVLQKFIAEHVVDNPKLWQQFSNSWNAPATIDPFGPPDQPSSPSHVEIPADA